MKRCLALLAALGAMAGAAQAGDHALYSSSSAYDWSGLYVGGYVGAIVSDDFTNTTDGTLTGLDGGALVYYNFPVHAGWVFSPFVTAAVPIHSTTISSQPVKVDLAVTAGGRVGYAIDRWLPYAFLGGAWATASANGTSNSHTGFVAGLGLDYAHSDRWVLGGRLSYLSLGEADYGSGPIGWRGTSVVGTISYRLH